MKRLTALTSVLLFSTVVHAQGLVVVAGAGSSASALSENEVATLYLGQSTVDSQGQRRTVYDLQDPELRGEFYREALSMSLIQLRAYRARQVFTGRGRPPRQLEAAELIERLNDDDLAIGYLPPEQARGLIVLYRLQP